MPDKLVLIGLSGTGKSSVGGEVAARIGWSFIDMDMEIERRTGRSIPEIFAEEGEAAFRRYERRELERALAQANAVIATGGGAVVEEDAWSPALLGNPAVLTVGLDAPVDVLLRRLTEASQKYGDAVKRPLLDAADAPERIRTMKAARAEAYARAAVTIPVGARSIEETAADLAELVQLANGTPSTVTVRLPTMASRITVGRGVRSQLAATIREGWPAARRVWVAADANVAAHAAGVRAHLASAGFDVHVHLVPAGEDQKSVSGLAALWDWLLEGGVQRQDVLVALGGGKVGDLAGFAAATVLRGIGLVQLPTTLLAMVDSSIGGKTAINHPTGKNLIGAFYQPAHVLIDPDFLETVPPRELASGWAEVIKHGEIQRSTPNGGTGHLREVLDLNRRQLAALREPVLSWVIRQNLTIKAAVVEADEREAGLRAILNYGHTLGHAIEASGYRYLHGEAIAVGLVAAIRLAARLGRIDDAEVARIESVLRAYGLPVRAEGDVERIMDLTASDKKKEAGTQLWILADGHGGVAIERDVPRTGVAAVAAEVVAGPAGNTPT